MNDRSFFSELRRRKVYRTGAAYVVGSLALWGGTELGSQAFSWSDRPLQVVIVLTLAGLLPALYASWLFDVRLESSAGRGSRLVPEPVDQNVTIGVRATVLHEVWDLLDANLQDAFALAYNSKRRERPERPTRISTRDLFRALRRIDDPSLQPLLNSLPTAALPEPDLSATHERLLLHEDHRLSANVEESLGAFAGVARHEHKVSPADIFVDISKHGHGSTVVLLREHGIGPGEIESRVESLGVEVVDPRDE